MSQEERTEVHRYPLRTSTRRWQRTLDRLLYVFVAVELLRFGWALTRGEVTVGPLIFLAVVAATRVFVRLAEQKGSAALLLSGSGVALGAQRASWEEIERIAPTRVVGKWGRRHEAFVLAEPKPISRALVPSGRYDHIPLGYWWPDWRASPIRERHRAMGAAAAPEHRFPDRPPQLMAWSRFHPDLTGPAPRLFP